MTRNNSILACDIGASKTNIALFSINENPLPTPIFESTLRSSDYENIETLLLSFLEDSGFTGIPEKACIGVPGPVIDNLSTTTNLPWFINGSELAESIGIKKLLLVNDILATGASIPLLDETGLFQISKGRPVAGGNIAVISPGTGLGEGFLVWDSTSSSYVSYPSEGGHCDFAPSNQNESQMLEYLRSILGHVSYESVCSGRGLQNIYAFLKESGLHQEPEWLTVRLAQSADPTQTIIQAARQNENPCAICLETVRIFVSILGAEAGNMAIKVMATGGVYIAGGIPARITDLLDSSIFLKGFLNKGRISPLLADIPVHVVLDQKAPLKGAVWLAGNQM